jgi:hypothetical protein
MLPPGQAPELTLRGRRPGSPPRGGPPRAARAARRRAPPSPGAAASGAPVGTRYGGGWVKWTAPRGSCLGSRPCRRPAEGRPSPTPNPQAPPHGAAHLHQDAKRPLRRVWLTVQARGLTGACRGGSEPHRLLRQTARRLPRPQICFVAPERCGRLPQGLGDRCTRSHLAAAPRSPRAVAPGCSAAPQNRWTVA